MAGRIGKRILGFRGRREDILLVGLGLGEVRKDFVEEVTLGWPLKGV